ncbi:MAG: hypothetical protein LQ340_003098 [Diploschistes diacapsis]|nr:MAG: hypothetical protein LQ340_003098 [Diploschistes diacapsis]
MSNGSANERSPLISRESEDGGEPRKLIEFSENDPGDPRNFSKRRKYANIAVIALMAVLSPLASAMFNPGIPIITKDLKTTESAVMASTTGFLVFLGIGPLVLAPLSETFGRRKLYLICFSVFVVAMRLLANETDFWTDGGGTLSDMFVPSERAGVYGYYLMGPLLGPAIGPLFGGLINEFLSWRWIFGALTIVCSVNTLAGFFLLQETYAPAILAARKAEYERNSPNTYCYYPGEDTRPTRTKMFYSMQRPLKILFLQPIVLTMAMYQAILFGTMYALYTNYPRIFGSEPYNFSSLQTGLLYLAPGGGSFLTVVLIVPRIDTIFNALTRKHNGIPKPEYRLPLANVGSVLVPLSLLWFGWCIQKQVHWAAAVASMPFFSIGQQIVFSSVQNYYIDAFEKYAASAIAAGAVFRAVVGGVVPVISPSLFAGLGYGWGFTLLAGLGVLLSPGPPLFYYYGPMLRERFIVNL